MGNKPIDKELLALRKVVMAMSIKERGDFLADVLQANGFRHNSMMAQTFTDHEFYGKNKPKKHGAINDPTE